MRVAKPMAVSPLVRCFEYRGKCWFSFTGMLMIGLGNDVRVFSEQSLWPFWMARPEAAGPLDEGVLRARAEYLVSGIAYPHGTDGRACAVEAQVGQLSKRLLVFGDRYWEGHQHTKPLAFSALPLTWERAYGGAGVPENPTGKGTSAVAQDGARYHWLPNIEDPSKLMTSPGDRVSPVGFGPIDTMWPQRTRYQGTYDETWLKTQFPAIAENTDWRYFNVAPPDQQQDQPFTGTESYAFGNLHPTQARLSGQLPGLRVRAFVTHRTGQEEKFKEIKTRLNTLWFFPDAERAILVFQGMHEIAEDDGADILHLLSAVEYLDQPRPAEHYLHVRDKRLDKENGAIEALREDDLMPSDLVVPLIDFAPREHRALGRGRRRAEAERTKARAEVASHGLNPDQHAPAVKGEAIPEIRNLDDLLRVRADMDQRLEKMKRQAEAEKAKSLGEAKAVFEREGKDFSLIEREMAGLETRGPPKPFADELIQSFHGHMVGQTNKAVLSELEHMATDKALHTQWRTGETRQLMAYRMTAHYQAPADRAQGEAAQAKRREVLARQSAGGDFRGWDLTGADLSGMDLSGANLEGALMERANLTGTTLRNANLRHAVLAHADLVSTQCQQTVFTDANLGGARIEKADFENADLKGAIFAKARLAQVSWRNARIDDVRLEEARIDGLDCSGARSEQLVSFYKLDLRSFNFSQARIRLAAFIECDVRGVDFSGAVFEKCAFVTVKAAGTRFRGMRIDSGCFVQQCDLSGADFNGASLSRMSFRGALLAGAQLEGAVLRGSDFSECELSQANLCLADAREARFVRAHLKGTRFEGANLVDAVFQHARLQDTNYRRANLFQSDFARVQVAPGVDFEGALCTRMRTLPRDKGSPPDRTAS